MKTANGTNSSKLAGWILLIIGAYIFAVASTIAIYQNLTVGATDIYPTWEGGKLFWEDNLSPYDNKVGIQSQLAIYDRLAKEDEDQFQFVYPFYLIILFGPLALLEFQLAAAIFMEFLLLLLIGSLALQLDTLGWLPKPITLALLLLTVITSYFSVRGLLLAQPAFLAFGFHIAAYWGIARRRDGFAGVMLALSTIKPQTGYILILLLLLWAFRNDRRQLVTSFFMTFTLLAGVSFILLPEWFSEWRHRVFNYSNYAETYPVAHILTHPFDQIPDAISLIGQIVLSGLILIPVAKYWYKAIIKQDSTNFFWGVMLAMCASLLIAPRVATTYYIELYPVLFVAAYLLEKRGSYTLLIMGTLFFIIGYWALHIATVPSVEEHGAGKESPIVYLIFPILIYWWLYAKPGAWLRVDMLQARPALVGKGPRRLFTQGTTGVPETGGISETNPAPQAEQDTKIAETTKPAVDTLETKPEETPKIEGSTEPTKE
ncbi:MAG: DUF2029 domain-containing protein [Chloroflexi bacterium]|nr:DUF2029 domain-containing protein [Chloroflexota bacterium]